MDWKADLEQIREDLPRLHTNFFHNVSREQFFASIDELRDSGTPMNPYKMVAAFARIIALAGDAHTTLEVPKNNRMPFGVYVFEEGIYIIHATLDSQEYLFHRILEVGGVSIEKVTKKLSEMISHENEAFLKARIPDFLTCTDVLKGLEIIPEVDKVSLKLESLEGKIFQLSVESIKNSQWEELQNEAEDFKLPLYRRYPDKNYWHEVAEAGKTLYVNYRKCKEQDDLPMAEFVDALKGILIQDKAGDNKIQRMVLDFRQNPGGNSELFRPFLEWLGEFQKSHSGLELMTIVGRDTFSSALLNVYVLKFKTRSRFVGEATGGKPNCYGEVRYFQLRESGLFVRYSTKYYYLIDDYSWDSFYPDEMYPVSIHAYMENRDPFYKWEV